jgi:prepilin-type N-terminal cleavage/methylation domain-containing protein
MQTRSMLPIRNPKSMMSRARRLHPGAYTPGSPRFSRSGFTLVEMMVVIVIIAILAGLLIPAIQSVKVKAIEGKVGVEIKGLESAIAAFKAKYGVEPPSRFTLYLTQTGWSNDSVNTAIIRQIWPQFDFTMNDPNSTGASAGTAYPLFWWSTLSNSGANGINMNSGECLLFFLGGVIPVQNNGSVSVAGPSGFSKNPVYPFSPPSASSNREGPFFEFTDLGRIRDIDGNGINEFYDPIPNQSKPYLYFSSYDGRGYNLLELPNNGTKFTMAGFESLHDVYRVYGGTLPLYPLKTPTSQVDPDPNNPVDTTLPTSEAVNHALNSSPQKPQTFQIISPGYDGEYGSGGVYSTQLSNSGLVGWDANGKALNPDIRQFDNITNFSGGRLKP